MKEKLIYQSAVKPAGGGCFETDITTDYPDALLVATVYGRTPDECEQRALLLVRAYNSLTSR